MRRAVTAGRGLPGKTVPLGGKGGDELGDEVGLHQLIAERVLHETLQLALADPLRVGANALLPGRSDNFLLDGTSGRLPPMHVGRNAQ